MTLSEGAYLGVDLVVNEDDVVGALETNIWIDDNAAELTPLTLFTPEALEEMSDTLRKAAARLRDLRASPAG